MTKLKPYWVDDRHMNVRELPSQKPCTGLRTFLINGAGTATVGSVIAATQVRRGDPFVGDDGRSDPDYVATELRAIPVDDSGTWRVEVTYHPAYLYELHRLAAAFPKVA